MSSAPPRIVELVETFDRNIETYHSQQYNETQLRREFIDPFFEELGWDVSNKQGYAQAYKEVIHEDAVKVGTATKAPDYSFRIDGIRILDLHKKLAKAKVPDEKTKLQRQISTTDNQIDNLVYELYGLTDDEIVIVEDRKT